MNVKFLLDENMPFALTEFLKKKGYEAKHLKKIEKGGIKNGEVYKVAEEDNAWIIKMPGFKESPRISMSSEDENKKD